jgi:hypothetical protein
MRSTLLPEGQWAMAEFGEAELGHTRRTNRLVQVAAAVAGEPYGTLPGSMADAAELKAAYRLLNNPTVDPAQLLAPHLRRTRAACYACRRCLLIEDTSTLDYSFHRACQELGCIGDHRGRGLFQHSTLAVDLEAGELLGLLDVQLWARRPREDGLTAHRERKQTRLSRARESQRWGRCLRDLAEKPSAGQWTYVADRESDIYEVLQACRGQQVEFVIRAAKDRALSDQDQPLFAAVAGERVRGYHTVQLRARPGQPARTALLEIRAMTLTLRGPWRPGGRLEEVSVNVVEAREVGAGKQALHWVLLTSWPIAALEQCREVLEAYGWRWLIEEYHKCLKSGCQVEKSQLESAAGLRRLVSILAVVALRLLDRMLLARNQPAKAVDAGKFPAAALAVLEAKFGMPAGQWTNRELLRGIARLGGFLGRKGDGEPGYITLWRGWQKLMRLAEGFELAAVQRCG